MKAKATFLFFLFVVQYSLAQTAPESEAAPGAPVAEVAPAPVVADIIIDHPEIIQERWESSPSSPPMATDDPGTPGKNGWEISAIFNRVYSPGSVVSDAGFDLPIGIGDTVQLRLAKGIHKEKVIGENDRKGFGASDVGIKWRFYEDKNGNQAAIFPSYRANDATRLKDADGNEVEPDGRSVYIPLILSRDINERCTVVANVAYRKNLDYSRKSSVFTSAALGCSVTNRDRAMIELASEANPDERQTDARFGWAHVFLPNDNSKYQVTGSASYGWNIKTKAKSLQFALTVSKKGS